MVVAGADVGVAAQALRLAPHDQGRLGVCLQAHDPVHDVHAGLLQHLSDLNVPLLVEPGFHLDQTDDLLARFGGADERIDERAFVARAIQRHFDPQHTGIVRSGRDEPLDAGGETLVGMMKEQIAAAYHAEDVGVLVGQAAWHHRRPGPLLQLRQWQIRDHVQIGIVQLARQLVHVRLGQLQLVNQELKHPRVGAWPVLQANDTGEPPGPQLLLDHLQQIVSIFLIALHVGIARDAKRHGVHHPHVRKQLLKITPHHLLEVEEAVRCGRP